MRWRRSSRPFRRGWMCRWKRRWCRRGRMRTPSPLRPSSGQDLTSTRGRGDIVKGLMCAAVSCYRELLRQSGAVCGGCVELAEEDGATVVAVSSHSRRLAEIFRAEGVDVVLADGLDDVPAAGSITLMQSAAGGLGDGSRCPFIVGAGMAGWWCTAMWRYSGWRSSGGRGGGRCGCAGMLLVGIVAGGLCGAWWSNGIGRFAGTVRGVKADAGSRAVSVITAKTTASILRSSTRMTTSCMCRWSILTGLRRTSRRWTGRRA